MEKFFDTVSQSKLIEVLSRTIKDGRVISLIHKYLDAGVIANGMFKSTEIGMPQGGPLSPLLSNVMLNELDKELERRGHRFVRYADDCMIFCKSRKSAERTLKNIIPFIEGKLFLKVNRKKTEVAHISKVKYLGYTFYRYKGKCRFRVHPKSVANVLTEEPTFITDLINLDEKENTVTFWHCGNAAPSLHNEKDGVKMCNHPLLGQGTAFWCSLKEGPVTAARFTNIDGQYRLFLLKGTAVPTVRNTRGSMVNVKVDTPVLDLVKEIAEQGMSHHYSLVWEDVAEQMELVAKLLNIPVIKL